jgi:hypothetical protein
MPPLRAISPQKLSLDARCHREQSPGPWPGPVAFPSAPGPLHLPFPGNVCCPTRRPLFHGHQVTTPTTRKAMSPLLVYPPSWPGPQDPDVSPGRCHCHKVLTLGATGPGTWWAVRGRWPWGRITHCPLPMDPAGTPRPQAGAASTVTPGRSSVPRGRGGGRRAKPDWTPRHWF